MHKLEPPQREGLEDRGGGFRLLGGTSTALADIFCYKKPNGVGGYPYRTSVAQNPPKMAISPKKHRFGTNV